MKKKNFIFLFLLLLINPASAQSMDIEDYSVAVGTEITIPISIIESESIAGGLINISFNSSIIYIKNVTAGDFGTSVANINNTNGWVRIVAADYKAINKNVSVLANLIINGTSNGSSDLIFEYASLNNETGDLVTPLISNGRITVSLSLDTTSPSSIYILESSNGSTWINWTWNNPPDSDFNHTMIYLDGRNVGNTIDQYFNVTDLLEGTAHTISTHTVDINGNINETWVNDTAKTTGKLPGGLHVSLNRPVNYSIYSVGEQVRFEVNVSDPDDNPISSDISAYVELSGPNNISRHIILSEENGHFVGGYTVNGGDPRGLWSGNVTAYNSTSSGQTSFKIYITGAYFIQPDSNSRSYLLGELATLTAKVAKPGNPGQYLSDQNVSLNLSIYPYNSSTPVLESVEMMYDDITNKFSAVASTDLIGSGLFTVLFIGNDTSGNIEVASLLIGVSEDYAVEVNTEKSYYDRDEPVNILGTVKYLNNNPMSNINVNLLLDLNGFQRSYVVNTNEIGEFNYTFHPFDTEAGNYTISATASNMGMLRTAENTFTIHGLYIMPQSAIVELVENSSRTISFTLYNLGDTTLTNISTSVNDLNISDNVIATIDALSVPSELQPSESTTINLQIEAGTPVPDEAVFQIEVTTAQMSNEFSKLEVKLFSPTPILKVYPDNVLVGLNKNQTAIRTVGIYNMGYGILRNVTLHQPENTWMRVTSNTSIGDLLPGENATFDIHINSYNADLGVYLDSVKITSDNYNEVQVNLTAFVTDLQNGSLLFHVADALERNVSNANISLISKLTYEEFNGITDSSGYALLDNLPIGKYIFEVSSDGTNTLPQMGTVEVEAMETPELIEIALYMSFIDFEWEVTPTSIEDYYNIILKMRFETDVPIPLLLAFPPTINYDMIPGEEKTDSFTLYNVGLVSIYNVSISPINYNGIVLEPLITTIDEIKGKSNVKIPYKLNLSESASNCRELSGKINIQGRYVHFINNHEVISYAGTSIPVTVKTPVDDTCKPDFPEWPDLSFCVNIDGLHFGDYTEDLDVDPNIIWLRTGPGWEDQDDYKSPVLENVAIATNNNEIGNIKLSKALGITFSIGVNELVSYFTAGTLTPQIPLGVDVVDVVADQYGINIPFFDGIWNGNFNPDLISPGQSSSLDMQKLDTGVGITLPKILGGAIGFQFGNESCYNCVWIIPIAGYDLTLPTFGLPDINIYIPHVRLPSGNIGGGTFCWNCFPDVFTVPTFPHFSGTTYVPWDWPEWNLPDFNRDSIHRTPPPKVTETIHEVIELSISQNVTMERDAFWAGLGIFNKMHDKNIDNVGVTLHIRDDTGSANDKFFIKSPNLININDVDGSGVISPLSLSTAQWLIIPKPGAGGINPEGAKYNISANITYSVDGINFETVTHEIEIVVKPQPEMVLDYFIPSDVIANKPFKLAVKLTNDGYGEARDFAIETAQPVIYYNPSGLLLDFEIIRSQLDGEERSTSMKVDFGDIQPGESKIAWWDMVTSIDGIFTEFTGEFTHSSELGGMETSLIKEINTYIIQKQLGTGELGYDFLANSESDENYYILFNSSTGSSTFVNNANYAVVNMPTPENPVLDVSIEDYTGDWVIVSIEDPYNNAVPIEKVIRTSDGTEIPSYNYWMRNGWILIVDHYDEGFDGKYTIQYQYSSLVPLITTNRTLFDGRIVVEENKLINFSGSDSYDEFGSIVLYKWELGDGTEKEGENIEHTYSQMGEYQVNLTIINNAGVSSQTSVKIYVVKQIVEVLVVPTNFPESSGEIPLSDIQSIENNLATYYLDISYNYLYLNFSNYNTITIKSAYNFENSTLIVKDALTNVGTDVIYNYDISIFDVNMNNINNDFGLPFAAIFPPIEGFTISIPAIFMQNEYEYGDWAHEIGHTLGYAVESSKIYQKTALPDLYPEYQGWGPEDIILESDNIIWGKNIWWWGIMGKGNKVSPPTYFSSFSNLILNWSTPISVYYGEYQLKPIEKSDYLDPVYIFDSGESISYIIEARDLPINNIDSDFTTDGTLENGVVIYKVENFDFYRKELSNEINQNWNINAVSRPIGIDKISFIDDPTLLAEDGTSAFPYIDLVRFVAFSISSTNNNPYYQPTVKIETPDEWASNKIGGVINNIKINIEGKISILNPLQIAGNGTSFPDIDLHAYTNEGLHVGINYSTNIYENQIPGAIASGDLSNGEEWIFVPKGMNISFYVNSHDVLKFLEENPKIDTSNVTIEYTTLFIEYGNNPELVLLPNGNHTVSNRTSSEPQVDTMVPGEIKEIILKDKIPPDTITNLTSINGTTWINFTWTNPSDPDFNHTELYLNGTFITNIPAPQNYYNATGLLPDTSYTLGTHTVDTAGNVNETWVNDTASTLPASGKTLDLYTGWNLISLPLMPEDTSITSLLSSINGNYSIVWAYNASDTADHWKKYDPAAPFENDLTNMMSGEGYWIMMTTDDTLNISGTVPEATDIELKSGWNLIGYNSLNPQPITNALSSINGNYSIIWAYNASDAVDHWKKYDPNAPFGNDLETMSPGYGYWIMMNSDDVLQI